MSSGVFCSYLVTALLVLAALLQVAVIRDRSIYITRAAMSARWLVAAGLLGLATRFAFFIHDEGELALPLYALASIGAVAFGLVALELPRFAPFDFMDTEPTEPGALDDVHRITSTKGLR
jgi:hypothetical protein